MKRKSLLMIVLMALFAPLAMNAQETLTVHDGTSTNRYVPFYGYYADEAQTNQMIYPAAELADMDGGEITAMMLYWTNGNYSGGSGVGTWTISIGETSATTLSGIDNTTSLTQVFSGDLDALFNSDDNTLPLTFNNAYTYNGGNLLVQFSHAASSYKDYAFYGETVTGASYCYNSQRNFLPKTTFTYEPAGNCAKPTDLAVNYTSGATTATVTWSGDARTYNIDVNGTVTNGVTSPYTLRNLTPNTTYTVKVQSNCGEEQSGWALAGSFTTPCEAYAIPYAYGFEDAGAMDCWTQVETELSNGYFNQSGNTYANTGNGCYYFSSYNGTTDPQYLISPELSGTENGVHVEFWYRKGPNGEESFKVGYSTTTNDVSSFQWDAEVTSLTTTYQQYKVNYMAPVKYVAIQYTGSDSYYVFIDDISFTEAPTCLEPTNVVVSNETTTGATISWTAGAAEEAWDIFVTDDASINPDETTTPTEANVATNSFNLTGLTPATIYYVYVRAICDETTTSAWTSATEFNTECEAMALPYSYDFNDGALSVCWSTYTTSPTYTGIELAGAGENDYVLMFFRGTSNADLAVVLPEVDATYPLNGYQITFDAAYYNGTSYSMTSGKLGIGIMTDPNDFTTFELIEEVTLDKNYNSAGFGTYTVMFSNYTGSGQYIAIQDIHTANGYVLVDNIEVTELPSCIVPTHLAVEGGKNAVVTWEGNAESFDIAYSTDNTVDPADNIVDNTTRNTFNLGAAVELREGDYYVWVRANCGTDGYSEWAGPVSFHVGFCTPNPTSHDGSGITGVSFGTGDYVVTNGDGSASLPASAPYYGDYTSMIGAVQAGVESTIAITTGTNSYPYTFVIWVDLDNSMSFEDSDIVYIGKASSGNGTLNATITVPATQATGDYRMRIYGADSYFTSFYGNGTTNWEADHDPCSSGSYRHAHDYTLRVLEAPSCLPAGDVTVTPESITSTSAVISWTNNNGADATYTVMQGETVLTTTAVDSYTLTLTAATDYPAGTFTIISDCDETMIANVPAFSTPCDAITTLPWSEDFESYDNNTVPMCWDNSASTSSTVSTSPYYIWGVVTVNDNNMMKMENYWAQTGTALINTPTIVLPAEGTCMFSFDYAHNASCGAFKVNVSKDNGATWTELASYTKGSGSSHTEPGDFTPASISLADYAGESIILQFFANANYGNGAIFVDNITVNITVNHYDKEFVTDGNWTESTNWIPAGIPTLDDAVLISANAIIPDEETAYAKNATLNGGTITIADGGQLKLDATVEVIMEKEIAAWSVEGYTYDNGEIVGRPNGYYLISSPLTTTSLTHVDGLAYVNAIEEEGYDLYTFDPTEEEGLEWINYRSNSTHANFTSGENNPVFVSMLGYLYANATDMTLEFEGLTAHKSVEETVTYEYTYDDESDDAFNGWQLVGNPFTCNASISYIDDFGEPQLADFYVMNEEGDDFVLAEPEDPMVLDASPVLHPLAGAFVNFGETVTVQFNSEVEEGGLGKGSIGFKLSQGRNKVVDQGRIRFGQGYNLKHLSFRRNSSKVYMPVDGNDYAVVYTENQGEMPISFKAENNGTYTLNFNTKNVELGYFHLIDNMTGNDVDLLATPSYTFEANTTDYANRFKLVFASGNADDTFAFFSNGSFVINNEGNATLQVIDVTGRILSSENINGCTNVNVNATPGVYMLRLVNGDNVKVQKVVVR